MADKLEPVTPPIVDEQTQIAAKEEEAKLAAELKAKQEKERLGRAEALALGITDEILKAFPELEPIFQSFVEGNIAKAKLDYFSTNYYQNLVKDSKSRRTKKVTQPGVYAQEFDAWKQEALRALVQQGFTITADMDKIIEDSFLDGKSVTQLGIAILNSGKMGKIGGSALGTVNTLKDFADDQGVGYILPKNYWDKVSVGLLSGTLTDESIKEELKGFAISAYPAYAKGIEAGRSFSMQTSAARQTMANLLEKDVDTITNNNPLFQKVTGYVNPKTGAFEIMPLWEVEKLVKSSEDWLYTKNAQNTFDSLGRSIARDWGLAY